MNTTSVFANSNYNKIQ